MKAPCPEVPGTRLLDCFLELLENWICVFSQERVFLRVKRQALGLVVALGTRTVSRVLAATGRDQQPWSSEYRLFSRSPWTSRDAFRCIIPEALKHCGDGENTPIVLAGDFTHLEKTGKKIPGVVCMRDPMSPAFHANLIYGLRFFQVTVLCRFHDRAEAQAALPTRSIPVLFEPSPVLRKPGKKASEEEIQKWKKDSRQRLSSKHARECLTTLREDFDQAGAANRKLFITLDGSFCNRVQMEQPLDRIELICRCRKDAVLCRPASESPKRIYGKARFTPEQVRQDESIPWKQENFFHGGAWHPIRYKDAGTVLWQQGARRRPLRLIVIAPTGYLRGGRKYYRQPGYLLTTDLESPAEILIDYYLQRWQIEVNHREEKDTFGVGHAQVRSPKAVPRQPAFAVAVYSLLLLAALKAYGPGLSNEYLSPPRWGRIKKRPSFQDLLNLIRTQIDNQPEKVHPLAATCTASLLIQKAAA